MPKPYRDSWVNEQNLDREAKEEIDEININYCKQCPNDPNYKQQCKELNEQLRKN